jgi:molybdopterin/thiamine biosynthesis adenylyltransferase
MSRYARQQILPEIGAAGQQRLTQARVLVVGAGGLGSPVLQYLAGAGVGHLTIVDPDHVEESNLHRQTLFCMADIGQPKAQAAAAHVAGLNPDVRCQAHVMALTPANAPALVDQVDLVVDAADSYAVSYTLSDLCLARGVPMISASVLGQKGYVGGFCSGAPSLRALFPDAPDSGASCATAGVMGPAVGVIGSLQAQMVLQVILQTEPSPLGQMLSLDLQSFALNSFRFDGAPEPGCAFAFIACTHVQPGDQVFDLRDVSEASQPAVPGAGRVVADLQPDQRVVLCCATGLRAWRKAQELHGQGYTNIVLLAQSAS